MKHELDAGFECERSRESNARDERMDQTVFGGVADEK